MYTYIHIHLILSPSYSAFPSPNNFYSLASLKPAKKNLREKKPRHISDIQNNKNISSIFEWIKNASGSHRQSNKYFQHKYC